MEHLIQAQGDEAALAAVFAIALIPLIIVAGLVIAGLWKIFTKAGEEGWKCLIPFYNQIVLLRIIGRPWWWLPVALLVSFIPFLGLFAGLAFGIVVGIDLAKSFGKDAAYGVGLGLLPFIFYPILGFGSDRYLGPAGPEPRPGYQSLGPGGSQFGGQGAYGGQGYQAPPGQQWGQPQQQGWGEPGAQQPQYQQPQPPQEAGQPQWGAAPPAQPGNDGGDQSGWGQPNG